MQGFCKAHLSNTWKLQCTHMLVNNRVEAEVAAGQKQTWLLQVIRQLANGSGDTLHFCTKPSVVILLAEDKHHQQWTGAHVTWLWMKNGYCS